MGELPRRAFRGAGPLCRFFRCSYSSTSTLQSFASTNIDVDALLAKPTWSVASLLPDSNSQSEIPAVSLEQLHHLLRLSALPRPKTEREENEMLTTLTSQLHFVREIQRVDASGIDPLRSLRDETGQGREEAELGIDELQAALGQEQIHGKYHKRIRRCQSSDQISEASNWDVLGTAERKVGRYLIVEGGKEK